MVEEASHLGVQQAVGRRVGGPVIAGSDRPLLGRLGSPGKTVAEQLVDEIREGISEWRPTEIVSAEKNAQWITGLVVELEPVAGNKQLVCRLSELISKRGPTKQMVAATPASCERYTYYLVGEISWLGNIVIQVAATFFMPPAAQVAPLRACLKTKPNNAGPDLVHRPVPQLVQRGSRPPRGVRDKPAAGRTGPSRDPPVYRYPDWYNLPPLFSPPLTC